MATRTLHARFASFPKTYGTFSVRFDENAAITYGKPTDRFYDPVEAHRLVVGDADAAGFVEKVRGSRRLLMRHDHLGRFYDAVFDVAGLPVAIAPLQQACGLPEAAPSAGPATAASASRAPRASRSGQWHVRESVSTLDDKPVVVLSASDRLAKTTLVLRCQGQTLEAYFILNDTVFEADRKTRLVHFAVSVDAGDAVMYDGPTTETNKAAFLPEGAPLVKALAGHRAVAFTYTPWKATSTKSATIDITGIDKALVPLLAACPEAPSNPSTLATLCRE